MKMRYISRRLTQTPWSTTAGPGPEAVYENRPSSKLYTHMVMGIRLKSSSSMHFVRRIPFQLQLPVTTLTPNKQQRRILESFWQDSFVSS